MQELDKEVAAVVRGRMDFRRFISSCDAIEMIITTSAFTVRVMPYVIRPAHERRHTTPRVGRGGG